MNAYRTDLASFADALASRLPGEWTSQYHQHTQYKDQFPLSDRVWDCGHVQWAVSEFVLGHHCTLTGPDDQQLCVIDRPLHRHQFLVAPLAPEDGVKPHHYDGVAEPNGIKVTSDPARAAAAVIRRVLPRYRYALAFVRHNAARQPEPAHRPGPPPVARVVTLTWYEDGALGTPYAHVPEDARTTLYTLGFQYHPHQAAFLLPAAYGEDGRAMRVQALVHQLAHRGIGVNLRHITAPTTTSPGPAVPAPTSAFAPGRHR
ncbi:hypothetical protein FB563_4050 [Streptomyces puniciscabiei]|uniref:Uncharacterized protein n=1 Tax=Streptomyces puniciscabiei TaxID=164348 RepID=A0A542UIV1_9ACTN|nr:hypothetical protein [Streptomyces puniciscabiei]TQK98997.1 hypothetical protein FB563_4050 [Streptomyces puniciscabiei]